MAVGGGYGMHVYVHYKIEDGAIYGIVKSHKPLNMVLLLQNIK
jgi:hypothetical protein